MMKYKGYRASVKYDDEAGVFHGEWWTPGM